MKWKVTHSPTRYAIALIVGVMPVHRWWAGPCIPKQQSGSRKAFPKSTIRHNMDADNSAQTVAPGFSIQMPKYCQT